MMENVNRHDDGSLVMRVGHASWMSLPMMTSSVMVNTMQRGIMGYSHRHTCAKSLPVLIPKMMACCCNTHPTDQQTHKHTNTNIRLKVDSHIQFLPSKRLRLKKALFLFLFLFLSLPHSLHALRTDCRPQQNPQQSVAADSANLQVS